MSSIDAPVNRAGRMIVLLLLVQDMRYVEMNVLMHFEVLLEDQNHSVAKAQGPVDAPSRCLDSSARHDAAPELEHLMRRVLLLLL